MAIWKLVLKSGMTWFGTWSICVFFTGGDFVHFSSFVYVAAFYDFKVQIPSNLGVQQDFYDLTCTNHSTQKLKHAHFYQNNQQDIAQTPANKQ